MKQIVIYCDGASRPSIQSAGIGLYFLYAGKQFGAYNYIGSRTNNEAEWISVLSALEICLKKRMNIVTIFSDSKLVVNQILGNYEINEEKFENYHKQAWEMISKFTSFSIQWIPRELNWKADELAGIATSQKNSSEKIFLIKD